MSDQRTAKNLRLEDDEGESATYIRLEDTGKDLADRWRLQAGETPSDWQPVEYDRPARGGGSWILPLLIGAIVVVVAVPLLYFGVNRLLNSSIATPGPADGDQSSITAGTENQDDGGGVTEETGDNGDVVEPAVTNVEATNTPEPEVIEPSGSVDPEVEPTAVLIEEEVALINSEFGVNARLEPSTAADVLRVLEQGEEVTILDRLIDEENDIEWLQVLTSEDAEVWISAAFVDITTRLVAAESGEVIDEAVVDEAVVDEAIDNVELVDGSEGEGTTAAPLDISSIDVTINSPSGLNARISPAADSEVVSVLEDGQTLKAVQRSDDDLWAQVELDDGQSGWVFLELVTASDDLSALPSESEVASQAAATVDAAPDDETNVSDEDDPAPEVEADPETPDDGTIEANAESSIPVVVNQYGVNARSTTSTEGAILQVVDGDSELVAIGRSEDSTWVQVPLEDGTLSWIFAEALIIEDDVSTLPVVTPPAVGDPAETLPEPLAAPADGSTDSARELEGGSAEDSASVETSGGITSTVPISLTVAITGTEESTSTLSVGTEPVTTTVSITSTSGGGLTSTIDSSVLVTATEAITGTGVTVGDPATGSTPLEGATATVISLIDAKARPIPSAGEESIQGIPNGDVLSAIGRSANNFWVQVELPDGTPAWVFANNVSLSVDISELPEVTPEE